MSLVLMAAGWCGHAPEVRHPRCLEHAPCHDLLNFLSVFERSGPYDRRTRDRYFRSTGTYQGRRVSGVPDVRIQTTTWGRSRPSR